MYVKQMFCDYFIKHHTIVNTLYLFTILVICAYEQIHAARDPVHKNALLVTVYKRAALQQAYVPHPHVLPA